MINHVLLHCVKVTDPDISFLGSFGDDATPGAIPTNYEDPRAWKYFYPANPEQGAVQFARVTKIREGKLWLMYPRATAYITIPGTTVNGEIYADGPMIFSDIPPDSLSAMYDQATSKLREAFTLGLGYTISNDVIIYKES